MLEQIFHMISKALYLNANHMKQKYSYLLVLVLLGLAYCKSPMPVTFNPDDHTNASGTAGSAKMTNQLPAKNNNVRIKTDSIKLPNDTARVRQ
jgi:hypothetical protein